MKGSAGNDLGLAFSLGRRYDHANGLPPAVVGRCSYRAVAVAMPPVEGHRQVVNEMLF